MDKNKSFQDLLQDSLKELQESKELKGEQHEQSSIRMDNANKTTSIGQNENRDNNRVARGNATSERPRISTNPFLVVGRYGNLSITERESSRNRLSENRDREINRSNMESRESRAESRTSRAESRESEDIKAKSGAVKATSGIIQEIYSTQNRLSQTERREFSEILRETEIFKQQALQTYTDIQDDIGKEIQENLTHTQDSKENQESHTNTNESHKEHTEYLHSQLKILKQHTDIFATTLSPTQKEQSYKKIIKALENIENLIESSNIDSKVLQNKNTQAQSTNTVSQNDTENLLNQDSNIALDKKDSMLIQKATKLVDEYERNMPRDKSRDR